MKDKKIFIILGVIIFVIILILGIIGSSSKNKKKLPCYNQTITIWSPYKNYIFKEIANDLSKYCIKIKIEEKNLDWIKNNLFSEISSGNIPDVVFVDSEFLIGNLKVFSQYKGTKININNYPEIISKIFNNQFYGYPITYDPLVLFWNKDLIYSIGYIEAPKTFEDIQNIIPQLRRSIFEKIEISPIALGTTENIDNYLEIFLILHKLINEENYKSKLAFYKTLDFYTQFADPSSQYYSWNSSMENQINSFSKGQLAMMINFYSKKVEILQKNSRLNFGIAPLPNFSESPKIINYFNCFFFAVPKQGKSKFGWMFLESLDKNYKNFINMLNLVPTKKEFFDKLNEEQKIVFQAILNSDMFLDFDKNNTRSVLKTAIDNWIYKRKEVENLLERSIYKIFKK